MLWGREPKGHLVEDCDCDDKFREDWRGISNVITLAPSATKRSEEQWNGIASAEQGRGLGYSGDCVEIASAGLQAL